ncbi:MAG: DUF885 domain-containing protein [Candidatus Methanofastidiosia archaeon]|jgi:uncharacterized protein (DUF885 family)
MTYEFDALVKEAFDTVMEHRPDMATMLGLHEYDTKMPSGTKDAQIALINNLDEYYSKFQTISKEELPPQKQIDFDLMLNIIQYHLFMEKEVKNWEKDPDLAGVIGYSIVPLFSRQFAPFEERLQSITARLQKCPQFVREFKSRITNPVKLWLDMAKVACSTLPVFFTIISQTAKEKGLETDELDEAALKTAESITEYMNWLDTLSCSGEPVLGRKKFETLIQLRKLGYTPDEILVIGEAYLAEGKSQLQKLASTVDPDSTPEHVLATMKKDHPETFEEVISEYQKAMATLRTLVKEKEFASLPEERLIVQETPVFLRHIVPIAAYFPPAPFEEDQMGIYFVTPVKGDALAEHNYTSIINTSVHEAYPGHHLQLIWANKHPSLVRLLTNAPEFVEGWAHYCEERMQNYGLDDNKIRLIQTKDMIFRAVRIIIDVNLHCNEMNCEQAITFLQKETGMDPQTATAEVKRYTKTPGQPLSYLLGKHMLLHLQKDVKTHMKDAYSEEKFHDAMLKAGSMPFPYMRRELKLKNML